MLRRFTEYHDLEGAFGRRAITERAKGILMRAKALLDENPQPSRAEIIAALDDNLCRCGTHVRILRAVERAAAAAAVGVATGESAA